MLLGTLIHLILKINEGSMNIPFLENRKLNLREAKSFVVISGGTGIHRLRQTQAPFVILAASPNSAFIDPIVK